jgi:putative oxygen-independent coproporphyrinogen III oxidase
MKSKELLEILSVKFQEEYQQISEVHKKGLLNSHLLGNKDSQSCVTYPPISKLEKNINNVYLSNNVTKNTLYIHIPFCTGICFYCSYKVKKSIEGSDEISDYISYLDKELSLILNKLKKEKLNVETIYIGGGTPSILSVKQLEKLLQLIDKKIIVSGEYTLETSPETVTLDKIKLAKNFGVNRVSMGVETWNNGVLKNINRRHTKEESIKSLDIFKKAGIEDIDIDLIRGLPGQTEDILIQDLIETSSLEIPSMTNYQYNIKPHSVDYKKITPAGYQLGAEELTKYAFYVFQGMSELGYSAGPPVGWFLKNSSVYQHNHLKWKDQLNQICLGVSSYGYYEGNSFSNSSSLKQYKENINNNELPIVSNTLLQNNEIIRRHFIFSLKSYVDINKFNNTYHIDLLNYLDIGPQIQYLIEINCLLINDNKIYLTDIGKLFVDQILMTFYSGTYKND